MGVQMKGALRPSSVPAFPRIKSGVRRVHLLPEKGNRFFSGFRVVAEEDWFGAVGEVEAGDPDADAGEERHDLAAVERQTRPTVGADEPDLVELRAPERRKHPHNGRDTGG
jgi:hypothetical protein